MKRDAIFYKIFQRFPDLIFEIGGNSPIQVRGYRFESVEVKETSFRIDGVFLPPANTVPKIIVFAEVQFQKDESLYHRFFTESFLYLYRNQALYDNWCGVLIFASRSLEPSKTEIHSSLLNGPQVQRVYLDELQDSENLSVGVRSMLLTIAPEDRAADQARRILEQIQQQETNPLTKQAIIEIVTTIVVYKFTNLTREEVEAMLGLNIEETKIYKDLERQMRLKAIPKMLALGMTLDQIAGVFEMTVDEVNQVAQQVQTS